MIRNVGFLLIAGALVACGQEFDVASVKAAPPIAPGVPVFFGPALGGPGTPDPTHIRWANVPLKSALVQAYDVRAYQITAPSLFDTERYDFAVTVPEGASKEQVGAMWRNLLKERFGMAVHLESREFPVDELVVARGGHKLQESTQTGPAEPQPKFENGRLASAGMYTTMRAGPNGAMAELMAVGQGIAGLVRQLSNQLGHPVVDRTGLTGKYDFNVEFAPVPYPGMPAALFTPGDPTLDLGAAVQQQLGLRLEKGKAPLDVIVVDKAEKVPTEN
jgi:uncharacterized protein (TIGR03435 family)